MELNGAKILYTIHTDIPLLGDLKITQTLVTTWIVMALLSGLAIWLGSNLKLENVSKRQAAAAAVAMGQTGKELQLCYLDNGTTPEIAADWTVRERT